MGNIQNSVLGAIRSVGVAAHSVKANKIARALADDVNPDNQDAASQIAKSILQRSRTTAQVSEERVKKKKQKKDLASVQRDILKKEERPNGKE